LHSTGSPIRTGLAAAASVVGVLVGGVVTGPITHRSTSGLVAVGADLVGAVVTAMIAILFLADQLPLPLLLALARRRTSGALCERKWTVSGRVINSQML
jgi:hypothetical protein